MVMIKKGLAAVGCVLIVPVVLSASATLSASVGPVVRGPGMVFQTLAQAADIISGKVVPAQTEQEKMQGILNLGALAFSLVGNILEEGNLQEQLNASSIGDASSTGSSGSLNEQLAKLDKAQLEALLEQIKKQHEAIKRDLVLLASATCASMRSDIRLGATFDAFPAIRIMSVIENDSRRINLIQEFVNSGTKAKRVLTELLKAVQLYLKEKFDLIREFLAEKVLKELHLSGAKVKINKEEPSSEVDESEAISEATAAVDDDEYGELLEAQDLDFGDHQSKETIDRSLAIELQAFSAATKDVLVHRGFASSVAELTGDDRERLSTLLVQLVTALCDSIEADPLLKPLASSWSELKKMAKLVAMGSDKPETVDVDRENLIRGWLAEKEPAEEFVDQLFFCVYDYCMTRLDSAFERLEGRLDVVLHEAEGLGSAAA
jgi:hypothetical protein